MSETAERAIAQPAREVTPAPPAPESEQRGDQGEELVLEDLLVEDVSIDGMCGVY
jgi:mycofactocin precursor